MRIDLRFTEQEQNTLLHYFGRHGINNRTLFIKEHFWRSFAQHTDEGINENIKIIREQAAQIESLSRQNAQVLKALAVGLLSSVDSQTRLKMNSLLDGMIDKK
jgi:ribosomal protein L15